MNRLVFRVPSFASRRVGAPPRIVSPSLTLLPVLVAGIALAALAIVGPLQDQAAAAPMARPLASYPNDPAIMIDTPANGANVNYSVSIAGWAIDRNATAGTGVDAIHIYRDGPAGQGGVWVGAATYGASRPDVGAAFGAQFTNSGWAYTWNASGTLPGSHTLYVYAHSTVSGGWTVTTPSVNLVLPYPGDPSTSIDVPAPGAAVWLIVPVSGWAIDRNAPSGTGVDAIHIYRDGAAGAGGVWVGAATYGASRPDVAAAYGPSFDYSGWSFSWDTAGLPNGTHTLYVYAHSTVYDHWTVTTRAVDVANGITAHVDAPAAGAAVSPLTAVSGWALDGRGTTGTGVDAVHIYRDGYSGGGGLILGGATYGASRPDLGALFGARFTNAGWSFDWDTTTVPPGNHMLYVYAHSTFLDQWAVTTQVVSVPNDTINSIQAPAAGAAVEATAVITGAAIDLNAPSGTGVDAVKVYRDGLAGGGGVYLGTATYGAYRPEMSAAYGSRFGSSGWSFDWDTTGLCGSHTLYVYAHSTRRDAWQVASRTVNVGSPPACP